MSRQPDEYERRILLVVIGLTPQIVTETLYKLAVDSPRSFVPTEIHLITTQEGARSAEVALLGVKGSQGMFSRFTEDYGFTGIAFPAANIHVITDTEGLFLSDAESGEHNRVAADFITGLVQSLSEDQESALHVSLAGGRKTMSYYAGYALSLFGRRQDRLSHVLVNAPFMNHADFFYPRPVAERLEVGNRYYSTDDARVILADIPYVRMRYQLPDDLLKGRVGFQEAVRKIQQLTEPAALMILVAEQALVLNGLRLKLSAANCAIYTWMARRVCEGRPPLCLDDDVFMDEYLAVYVLFVGAHSGRFEAAEKIAFERKAEDQKKWFLSRRTKLNTELQIRLGERLAYPFLIKTTEQDGKVFYALELKADQVEIVDGV